MATKDTAAPVVDSLSLIGTYVRSIIVFVARAIVDVNKRGTPLCEALQCKEVRYEGGPTLRVMCIGLLTLTVLALVIGLYALIVALTECLALRVVAYCAAISLGSASMLQFMITPPIVSSSTS